MEAGLGQIGAGLFGESSPNQSDFAIHDDARQLQVRWNGQSHRWEKPSLRVAKATNLAATWPLGRVGEFRGLARTPPAPLHDLRGGRRGLIVWGAQARIQNRKYR